MTDTGRQEFHRTSPRELVAAYSRDNTGTPAAEIPGLISPKSNAAPGAGYRTGPHRRRPLRSRQTGGFSRSKKVDDNPIILVWSWRDGQALQIALKSAIPGATQLTNMGRRNKLPRRMGGLPGPDYPDVAAENYAVFF